MWNTVYSEHYINVDFSNQIGNLKPSYLDDDMQFFNVKSVLAPIERENIREALLKDSGLIFTHEEREFEVNHFLNEIKERQTQIRLRSIDFCLPINNCLHPLFEVKDYFVMYEEYYRLITDSAFIKLDLLLTPKMSTILEKKMKEIGIEYVKWSDRELPKVTLKFRWNEVQKVEIIDEKFAFWLETSPIFEFNKIKIGKDGKHANIEGFNPFFDFEKMVDSVKMNRLVLVLDLNVNKEMETMINDKFTLSGSKHRMSLEVKDDSLTDKLSTIYHLFDSQQNFLKFIFFVLECINEGVASYLTVCELCTKLASKDDDLSKAGLSLELINAEFEGVLMDSDTLLDHLFSYQTIIKPDKERVMSLALTLNSLSNREFVKENGNNMLRAYSFDFLSGFRVSVRTTNDKIDHSKLSLAFFTYILVRGIRFGNQNYIFYGTSNSQLKSGGCWMFEEEKVKKIPRLKGIKSVSKYLARLGLKLTTTKKAVDIPKEDILKIPDIENEDYNWSDGVAPIDYDIAKRISQEIGLETVPSAIQGRFRGCKGVWTVVNYPGEAVTHKKKLYIRKSQEKYDLGEEDTDYSFQVCGYSTKNKFTLNKQIIFIIFSNGVTEDLLIRAIAEHFTKTSSLDYLVNSLDVKQIQPKIKQISSFVRVGEFDSFTRILLDEMTKISFHKLKTKMRVFMENGAVLMGIVDEYNVLEEGEVFIRVQDEDTDKILEGLVLVTKCPCLHPGDVRKLKCVNYSTFNGYRNVVVFPQKGKRPHPNEIAGSDLDGDLYHVIYDKAFIDSFREKPAANFEDYKGKNEFDNITVEQLIDYFLKASSDSNLGSIANTHTVHSDKHNTVDNKDSLQLAFNFFRAVDSGKSGEIVRMADRLKVSKYPHYMCDKDNTYISSSILGKMFDEIVHRIDEVVTEEPVQREQFVTFNTTEFTFEAIKLSLEYFREIKKEAKKWKAGGEIELLTGKESKRKSGANENDYDRKRSKAESISALMERIETLFQNGNVLGEDSVLAKALCSVRRERFFEVLKTVHFLRVDPERVKSKLTESLEKVLQWGKSVLDQRIRIRSVYGRIKETKKFEVKRTTFESLIKADLAWMKQDLSVIIGQKNTEKNKIFSLPLVINSELLLSSLIHSKFEV